MEVSGVVFRPLPCLSGASFDTQSFSSSKLSFFSSRNVGDVQVLGGLERSRKVLSCGFSDNGHVQYYVSTKAGMKMDKEKKSLKKKLKLVKGMSKDLLRFSSMGFGLETEDGLIVEVKEKKISEATEILLSQLKQLKAEEKELKRKRKEEKAKLKALMVNESSSSSSESSESECGEVIDTSSLRVEEPQIDFDVPLSVPEASTSCSSVKIGEKIEVCMGGKCKRSGATALLEEFQQRVGIEGAVVGCKCMGKCRDGPNVRVVNQSKEELAVRMEDGVKPRGIPLCIGVGLEDVGAIVGKFFGEERKEMGLMVA